MRRKEFGFIEQTLANAPEVLRRDKRDEFASIDIFFDVLKFRHQMRAVFFEPLVAFAQEWKLQRSRGIEALHREERGETRNRAGSEIG